MDVKLSLKLSKAVHDRCHNVPHDIGIELEQIVREHQNEQLNKLSVVRGGDKENQTVKRKKKFYNYPSYKGTPNTPPEPLATEAEAQGGRVDCANGMHFWSINKTGIQECLFCPARRVASAAAL
jgi:hypothetical protein